jgi:HK97 family phage major capsid protein
MIDEKKIDELNLAISRLDAKVQEFDKAKEKGLISKADFDEKVAKIDADQEILAKEVAALKVPKISAAEIKEQNDSFHGKAFSKFLRKGVQSLTPDEVKVLVISDDTQGGYLATPPEYMKEIIKGVTLMSPIRQLARVQTTSSGSFMVPKRTAQFSAVRVSEIGTKSERTGLTYGLEQMNLGEVYADVRISKHNIEDSAFNLEGEIASEIVEQFGVLEGTEFVSGSGANDTPEGIMTHSDLKVEGTGCRHTKTTVVITIDDLLSVKYLLASEYARNAAWLMKRDVAGYLRTLKDGASGTSGAYYWQPSVQAGEPDMLLGSPVYECPDMTGLTAGAPVQNTYPIAYGDFKKGYLIVDRLGIEIQRLVELYAATSTIGFLARRRYNGQVVLSEAIKTLMID